MTRDIDQGAYVAALEAFELAGASFGLEPVAEAIKAYQAASPFQSSAGTPDGPFGPHTEAPEAIKSEPDMTDQQEKVDALVAELRAAAEKATPGEWRAVEFGSTGTYHIKYGQDGCWLAEIHLGDDTDEDRAETRATAELVALANPANILTLLTAFAAEREENERLRKDLAVIGKASEASERLFGGSMSEVTRVFQNITRVARLHLSPNYAALVSKALPNTGEQSQ